MAEYDPDLDEGVEIDDDDFENGRVSFKNCRKNPGHTTMIRLPDFKKEDLFPYVEKRFSLKRLHKLILYEARRTVKVIVPFISPERPDKYPMSNHRGTWRTTVGSGWANIDTDDRGRPCIDCPLDNCPIPRPHKTTPVFPVTTAAHVVFDNQEARHATLEFFYDTDDRSGVITAQVIGVSASSVSGDVSVIDCTGSSQPSRAEPSQDVPSQDVPSEDVPSQGVPSQGVPSQDVPSEDEPSEDVPSEDKPSQGVPSQDVPSQKVLSQDVSSPVQPSTGQTSLPSLSIRVSDPKPSPQFPKDPQTTPVTGTSDPQTTKTFPDPKPSPKLPSTKYHKTTTSTKYPKYAKSLSDPYSSSPGASDVQGQLRHRSIQLDCVSHDLSLFDKVCMKDIPYDYLVDLSDFLWHQALQGIVVVISHPHGHTKHVSLGTVTGHNRLFMRRRDIDYEERRRICSAMVGKSLVKSWQWRYYYYDYGTPIRYDAATCPGSSGGRVLAFEGSMDSKHDIIVASHSKHCGGRENASGMTFSAELH